MVVLADGDVGGYTNDCTKLEKYHAPVFVGRPRSPAVCNRELGKSKNGGGDKQGNNAVTTVGTVEHKPNCGRLLVATSTLTWTKAYGIGKFTGQASVL